MISHRDRRALALYLLGAADASKGYQNYREHLLDGARRAMGERGIARLSKMIERIQKQVRETR